jgi:hypothetical protein
MLQHDYCAVRRAPPFLLIFQAWKLKIHPKMLGQAKDASVGANIPELDRQRTHNGNSGFDGLPRS